MADPAPAEAALDTLEANDRSLILSFLSLSARNTGSDDVMEHLAEAIALRAAFRETPN